MDIVLPFAFFLNFAGGHGESVCDREAVLRIVHSCDEQTDPFEPKYHILESSQITLLAFRVMPITADLVCLVMAAGKQEA